MRVLVLIVGECETEPVAESDVSIGAPDGWMPDCHTGTLATPGLAGPMLLVLGSLATLRRKRRGARP